MNSRYLEELEKGRTSTSAYRHNFEYARLMWFHHNKVSEMLQGFYGLHQ